MTRFGLSSGLGLYVASVHKVNRRVEDHEFSLLDPVPQLHLCSQIAGNRNFPDVSNAVFHYGHLQAVAVEDDGLSGNQQRRRPARNMKLDKTVRSRLERTVRIRNINLGQERPRPRLQRVGGPCYLSGVRLAGIVRYAYHGINPRSQTGGLTLRHIDLRSNDITTQYAFSSLRHRTAQKTRTRRK
jgi:hypothetical protein